MPGKVSITAEEKHLGDVTGIIYHDHHVYTSGADGKLKIFDEDLKLIKEVNDLHEAHIYAIAIDSKTGRLFSSSCDSYVKMMPNPLETDQIMNILHCPDVEVESLYAEEGRLLTGDDHGGVTVFVNGVLKFKLNIIEAVHGLIVEENYVYTIRNMDLSVHEFHMDTERYFMKGQIPGKSPICLCGKKENGRSEFVVVPDRGGKGLQICKNSSSQAFRMVYSVENAHEMIINGLKGTENHLFTCCYAGAIKKWNLDLSLAGDVLIGICANTLAVLDDNTVYVGFTDGSIRKITF